MMFVCAFVSILASTTTADIHTLCIAQAAVGNLEDQATAGSCSALARPAAQDCMMATLFVWACLRGQAWAWQRHQQLDQLPNKMAKNRA
jgi:hypothetical protein